MSKKNQYTYTYIYILAASVSIAGAAETSTSPSSYAMIRMLGAHLQQQQSVAAAAAVAVAISTTSTTTPTITTENAVKFHFGPNMTTGCDSMLSTMANFSMTSNANNSIGPQCQQCGKNYSNASNLRQHVRNVHVPVDKSLWHTCHTCGKKLKTKHYLINHQLQAHGIHQRTGIGGPSLSSSLSNEDDLMDTMHDSNVVGDDHHSIQWNHLTVENLIISFNFGNSNFIFFVFCLSVVFTVIFSSSFFNFIFSFSILHFCRIVANCTPFGGDKWKYSFSWFFFLLFYVFALAWARAIESFPLND